MSLKQKLQHAQWHLQLTHQCNIARQAGQIDAMNKPVQTHCKAFGRGNWLPEPGDGPLKGSACLSEQELKCSVVNTVCPEIAHIQIIVNLSRAWECLRISVPLANHFLAESMCTACAVDRPQPTLQPDR